MPMISEDLNQKREDIRTKMQQALISNDNEKFTQAMDEMSALAAEDVLQQARAEIEGLRQDTDAHILANRGVRQLTSEERTYYQKVIEAMKAPDVKQALNNVDLTLPKTTMNAIFDELQTRHPLLNYIQFIPTTGLTEMIMNTNGYQEALWGDLCDEIVKEVSSGFKIVNMALLKLSALLYLCKAMLDLGPEWLDNYVRQVLYEALANGLEAAIVAGDGNKKPIGMNRQVGDNVTVTGGVYPAKAKITVNDLSPATIGNLLSIISIDPNGKSRVPRDLILLVNPADYYQKVMPATTLMAPDGSYRNDVLPYPMRIIQTPALERGNASG